MTEHKTEERIAIEANVSDERRTEGFVSVVYLNPAGKMRQALKKLALFWIAALFSVLLPVIHFISVPVLFGLGIFFARRTYTSAGRVTGGLTRCPHCNSEVPVKPAELQWPVTEICQGCARVVRLERK